MLDVGRPEDIDLPVFRASGARSALLSTGYLSLTLVLHDRVYVTMAYFSLGGSPVSRPWATNRRRTTTHLCAVSLKAVTGGWTTSSARVWKTSLGKRPRGGSRPVEDRRGRHVTDRLGLDCGRPADRSQGVDPRGKCLRSCAATGLRPGDPSASDESFPISRTSAYDDPRTPASSRRMAATSSILSTQRSAAFRSPRLHRSLAPRLEGLNAFTAIVVFVNSPPQPRRTRFWSVSPTRLG